LTYGDEVAKEKNAPMLYPLQPEQKQVKWRQFLEEVKGTWANRGIDVLSASDELDLRRVFQDAGLSEQRSSREVEEMLRSFDERLRRAA
jgi:hypothetical protein